MSQAASQAAAFYRDVAEKQIVWTVGDDQGYPAPKTPSGRRAMPFWSSKSRVQRIIKNAPAYAVFEPIGFTWQQFVEEWLPIIKDANQLVGVNWSGKNVVGYDLEPDDLVANVEYHIRKEES